MKPRAYEEGWLCGLAAQEQHLALHLMTVYRDPELEQNVVAVIGQPGHARELHCPYEKARAAKKPSQPSGEKATGEAVKPLAELCRHRDRHGEQA